MDKIWIGTNWKMTKTLAEGLSYSTKLKSISKEISPNIELFIIPSYTALLPIKEIISGSSIQLGAQNMHWEDRGAYTGEISPKMLDEIGIDIIELGHSERRQYFNENDNAINKKVLAALKYNMKPLICIGENLEQKNNNISKEILATQLKVCLKHLSEEQARHVMVAYEPVWAIGEQGIPADAEYIAAIHTFIRDTLKVLFPDAGIDIPLLYGGSVNQNNFLEYIEIENVDGLFIGRAAWDIESFQYILKQLDSHMFV
ncbi:triose-phosphate isomerase [Bacillus ginsengihumi]|uniref:Triosephosphate isomerase n=1 Tax=Heyndrickxia ginsengihumi TaxID=363870 RepID=A0A0A6VFC1_9BACI|nr:triose-phosphate isomerase [Heyndrickxia ginsengihumi]KHD85269.1 triosephosphate isomerase [Heyndrickxia ginsengihumi]NEY19319.1 triose-phosphate isomerase [Heyndrickxia ginsengihumi]